MAPRDRCDDAPAATLDTLRAEIDRLDDALLGLIQRRLALAAAMGPLKRLDGGLALRPERESEILRRLTGHPRGIPDALIRAVWRELMSHGLQVQRPAALVLHGGDIDLLLAMARERFGSAAPARIAAAQSDALEAALDGGAIAMIETAALPDRLQPELRLIDAFARRNGSPFACAVGRLSRQG